MLDELAAGCFEVFWHWILGLLFAIAGAIVAIRAFTAADAFQAHLAAVLFHTSALLLVGVGLGRAKRFLGITWLVNLAAFLALAAIFHS